MTRSWRWLTAIATLGLVAVNGAAFAAAHDGEPGADASGDANAASDAPSSGDGANASDANATQGPGDHALDNATSENETHVEDVNATDENDTAPADAGGHDNASAAEDTNATATNDTQDASAENASALDVPHDGPSDAEVMAFLGAVFGEQGVHDYLAWLEHDLGEGGQHGEIA